MEKDNTERSVIDLLRESVSTAGPGGRLPSVRTIMRTLHVSPMTVQHAMRQLVAEGLIEVTASRGAFVARRPHGDVAAPDLAWQSVALGARTVPDETLPELLAVPDPDIITLSSGYLDAALQPVGLLGAALARAGRRPAAWDSGPVEGRTELRAWFAAEAGGGFRAADMVVCPGGQAALSTAFRALNAPGDPVLVEAPTYLGAIAAARNAGLRVVPVPADADGVRPDLLAAAFARTGARLFYCQPLYANPHGGVLAADRRGAVLHAVQQAGAFLLEDDWARDLTIEGAVPPPLAAEDVHGHVIYLRSVTKSAAPGLRVASIGARGAAGARLRAARTLDDFFVSGPLQETALDVVTSPAWRRHRTTVRQGLMARRDALLHAFDRYLPDLRPAVVPAGGLHLWVRLPDGVDDVVLAAAAAAHGVVVHAGRPWYPADPPAPHLRLTYGAVAPETLDEGVHRLARAFATIRR